MNKKTYEGVMSVVRGESIGCVNTYNEKEFDEVSKAVIGDGCFGDTINSALISVIIDHVKKWRSAKMIDDSFDYFDMQSDDKDYAFASQFGSILFPEVLSYCIPIDKGHVRWVSSVYHFATLNEIDHENICDMFVEPYKDYVRRHISGISEADKIIDMIYDDSIVTPF